MGHPFRRTGRPPSQPILRLVASWRGAAGIAVAAVLFAVGAPWWAAVGAGLFVLAIAVGLAVVRPVRPTRPPMDPFTLGEPWRRFVQGTQRAERQLHRTVSATRDGPLRERLDSIVDRLDHGLDEVWEVARRGNEVDRAIRRLDPTALRARLSTFSEQQAAEPSPELDEAIASVQRQLEAAQRLRVLSNQTALRLRVAQTRFEELATRAEEVSVGISDTDRWASDADDLVVELEAIRLALEDVRDP